MNEVNNPFISDFVYLMGLSNDTAYIAAAIHKFAEKVVGAYVSGYITPEEYEFVNKCLSEKLAQCK